MSQLHQCLSRNVLLTAESCVCAHINASCMQVAEKVNALARGKPNNSAGPEVGAVIVESGQLR